MIFKKGIPILGNKRSLLLLRSILTIFAMTSYFYTIKVMILTDALTIKQLAPLLSIFFAAIILKEKVNFKQISIFIFGFLGMLLIVKPGIRPYIFRAIIGLGGATLTAISYIMIRYLRSDDHPLVIVNYFGYVIGLTSLGVLLWQRIFLFRAKK
jgi:drug/metabolite transporter (DMT)-like permease